MPLSFDSGSAAPLHPFAELSSSSSAILILKRVGRQGPGQYLTDGPGIKPSGSDTGIGAAHWPGRLIHAGTVANADCVIIFSFFCILLTVVAGSSILHATDHVFARFHLQFISGVLLLMQRFAAFCLLTILPFGCSQSTTSPASNVQQASEAELSAIRSLTDLAVVVTTDEGGRAADLDLRKATVDAVLLEKITGLSSLRSINLADTGFSEALLSPLKAAAPNIINLDLRGCQISDAAMPQIAEFKALKVLRFSGKSGQTTITDDGLAPLASLKSLKVLAFDDLWISNIGLTHLLPLTYLEELYLAATIVDDEAISTVARFSKLRKLRLARTSVGDAALESLKNSKTLEELDLSENAIITDAGMVSLSSIASLKKLNLWRVQISDTGALALAPLTNLTWLNLDNTKLSDAGLPALKDMNQLTFLHLGSTQITEAGAPALFHLKSLKDLKITRTALGASETAVAELKKNLPETAIQTEYEGQ